MRDKFPRLRPVGELDELGQRLMDEAESADWSARRRAVHFRDGLTIALLACRPVRLKNLAAMRLGRHLLKEGATWQMLFDTLETKTHASYEGKFPAMLALRLERYLEVHRPVLLRGKRVRDRGNTMPVSEGETSSRRELDALWVSEVGTQLEEGALASRIVKQTRAAFGQSLSTHLFRDCVATSIALDNPRHIGDASLVLGHADHRTTEKHYNHARSIEASRRHATTIARLKETLNVGRSR